MSDNETAVRCRDAMWADDLASQALEMEVDVTGPGRSAATMGVSEDMVNGHDVCLLR